VRYTEAAGLFLLVPIVERLDWPERIRRSTLGADYGTRAVTYVLTGTALALLGHPATEVAPFDPGVAIFAGWGDSPDHTALARACRRHDATTRAELLRLLVGDDVDRETIAGWDGVFAALGSHLVRKFAERLRGLSRSSERFIVDRLLAVPGTVALGDRRVLVRLGSNTFWPVVRLSGADAAVDGVSWLGGRRLEFELEGV
jgi:hypothetical protein